MPEADEYEVDQPVLVIVRGKVNAEWDACTPGGVVDLMLEVKYHDAMSLIVPQDSEDVTILASSNGNGARTRSIKAAKRSASIGRLSDTEDWDTFARELEARGWTYTPPVP